MGFSSINFSAILVAAIAAFFVGFLWHGPLFGNRWARLMGITKAEMEAAKKKGMGPMLPSMIGAFVQQVIVAAAVSHLANALAIATWEQALAFSVFIWFAFYVTTLLNSVLWEKRKPELFFINIGYHLVDLVVISLIVVMWK